MRRPGPALALAFALTLGAALPARAAEILCRPNVDFCVEVDGKYPRDARFFTSEARGKFLADPCLARHEHGLRGHRYRLNVAEDVPHRPRRRYDG